MRAPSVVIFEIEDSVAVQGRIWSEGNRWVVDDGHGDFVYEDQPYGNRTKAVLAWLELRLGVV